MPACRAFGNVGTNDRDRRVPAFVLLIRVDDLNVDLVRLALGQEAEGAHCQMSQVFRRSRRDQLHRNLGKEEFSEAPRYMGFFRGDEIGNQVQYSGQSRCGFPQLLNRDVCGVAHYLDVDGVARQTYRQRRRAGRHIPTPGIAG